MAVTVPGTAVVRAGRRCSDGAAATAAPGVIWGHDVRGGARKPQPWQATGSAAQAGTPYLMAGHGMWVVSGMLSA